MKPTGIHFIASVNEDKIGEIRNIAQKLTDLGCHIDNVMSFSGIITGSTAAEMPLSNVKIDGIKHVEPDRDVRSMR